MRNLFWFCVLLVGLPATILLTAHAVSGSPNPGSMAIQLGFLALLAGVASILSMINGVASRSGIARVRAFGVYTYDLPEPALRESLRTARCAADLGDSALSIRTNGVSIPGYHAGWFRTKGNRKAFAAIVDTHAPITVIRTGNVDVLVSESLLKQS